MDMDKEYEVKSARCCANPTPQAAAFARTFHSPCQRLRFGDAIILIAVVKDDQI